ncbi:hypothetical protein GQ43DRAFT_46999 [Delitschia confertaspora ATCC 74209]|uniref:Uncharacterized protein n=1 Tax=Delitschia confertaspora ATCC 74209 TaxID=1513339 RepID=A0A9P4JQA4_9PLEO|nr:hypothetical protein GQ43DRAFT_46999 [Delitschia confertaspora ATCC 74209]
MCYHRYTGFTLCDCVAIHSHQCCFCDDPLMLVFCEHYTTYEVKSEGACPNHARQMEALTTIPMNTMSSGSIPTPSPGHINFIIPYNTSIEYGSTYSKTLLPDKPSLKQISPENPSRPFLPRPHPALDLSHVTMKYTHFPPEIRAQIHTNGPIAPNDRIPSMDPPSVSPSPLSSLPENIVAPSPIGTIRQEFDSAKCPNFNPSANCYTLFETSPAQLSSVSPPGPPGPPRNPVAIMGPTPRRQNKTERGTEAVIVAYNGETREFKRPEKRRKSSATSGE